MNPTHLALLEARWQDYVRALRHAWVRAPSIERRFFHTQSIDELTADSRILDIHARRAFIRFQAFIRKTLGRTATAEPVGRRGPAGMPVCILVRVPKAGALLGEERLYGTPRADDEEGRALVAGFLAARKAEREQAVTRERVKYLDAKLKAAVAKHHEKLVEHAKAKMQKGSTVHKDPHARKLQMQRARMGVLRTLASVNVWRNKLAALGIERDITNLDAGQPL